MTNESWYEVVLAETSLTQGDLIFDCPVIAWKDEVIDLGEHGEIDSLKQASHAIATDVVVMTQACDLANDKIAHVTLCPHSSISDYHRFWEEQMLSQGQNPKPKAWRSICDDICDGYMWNLAMLNHCENNPIVMEHRIVDFRYVYTVPRTFLESLLLQRSEPRLRLKSPYREHLSQAFARFFMRVGLPTSVENVWK